MRILLVGEYSRLHNSLKEGLVSLGHQVTIIGNGDSFKKYPVDIYITHSFNNWFLKKIKAGIYKLFGVNLSAIEVYYKSKKVIEQLPEYDVVQLINELAFKTNSKYEIKLLKKLKTKKLYLLSCGVDYYSVKFMMEGGFRYSIMTPYLDNTGNKKNYKFKLGQLSPEHKKLQEYIYENCNGIIASDMDYHLPLVGWNNYLGLIPNAINTEKIKYIEPIIHGKIKIFHGVNKAMQHKKGNAYFFEALEIIQKKYHDKVEIITTYSLPYKEYIKIYDSCHILLDQIYGYDQGYNALEAMAKGKVVFTGAEEEWLDYYKLEKDTIAINTLPDVNYLVEKLEWLILNPKKIIEISKNARNFIEEHHNYIDVANKYLKTWQTN